jgi:hypothetical protein
MLNDLVVQYNAQLANLHYLFNVVCVVLNLLFAGAVARDAGSLSKTGQHTALVSPATWAFATLTGGIFTAAIYWFIHHSTFTRPLIRKI